MPELSTVGAEVKGVVDAVADTNFLTDAEKTKLAGIAEGAQVNAVTSVNGATGAVNVTTITGNAGTATQLATARTINGTAFNGTQNIVITPRVGTTASSATPAPNADSNDLYTITALAANATFSAPSGTPVNGQALVIRVKDNGTARTLAFNAIYRAIGITLPTTTVASKTLYLGMIYNSADAKWDVLGVSQEA